MHGNSMRENRETPSASVESRRAGGEGESYKASMHAGGESDERVVPTKRPNNSGGIAGGGGGGKPIDQGEHRRGSPRPDTGPERESQGLGGVREAARKDKRQQFTALLHHVTVGLLRDSYYALKRQLHQEWTE